MDPVTIGGLTVDAMTELVKSAGAAVTAIVYIVWSNKVKLQRGETSSSWLSPRFWAAMITQIQVLFSLFM